MNEESKWHCYVCRPEPLQDFVKTCEKVLLNLESSYRKPKGDKTKREDRKHKHNKREKTAVNGQGYASDGAGSLSFSCKTLTVPKELVKKTKKLIETTNGLNRTFVQFLQHASEGREVTAVSYRHLKAFKSVLADLKKAHGALEESLEKEFESKGLKFQNGEEQKPAQSQTDPTVVNSHHADPDPVREDALDCSTTDQNLAVEEDENQPESHPADVEMKESLPPSPEKPEESEAQEMADNPDFEENSVPAGEASLDKDIVSVPPSVPEELFEMVESLAVKKKDHDDDNSTDSSDGKSTPKAEVLESNKSLMKLGRKLVVKLTPVPLKITIKRDKSKDQSPSEDMDTLPKEGQDSRRSPRMKTTPLRKSPEAKSKRKPRSSVAKEEPSDEVKPKSDSDSDEVPEVLQTAASKASSDESEPENTSGKGAKKKTVASRSAKPKRKLEMGSSDSEQSGKSSTANKTRAKKKKGRESDSSNHNSDLEKSKRKPRSSVAKEEPSDEVKPKSDSDSDEVPEVLQTAASKASSDESEPENTSGKGAKKKTVASRSAKPKRKLEMGSSDSEQSGKSSTANKTRAKKKKGRESDSSNHNSDLEKQMKSLSKIGSGKKTSKAVKKEKTESSKEGKKGPKRSFERKRRSQRGKAKTNEEVSSSDEEQEEEDQAANSDEDSDQQKIKPILESVMASIDGFHQSSGQSKKRLN